MNVYRLIFVLSVSYLLINLYMTHEHYKYIFTDHEFRLIFSLLLLIPIIRNLWEIYDWIITKISHIFIKADDDINLKTNFSFVHKNDIKYSLTFQPNKNKFSLDKYQNEKMIYSSKEKNHKISKRLYYILSNIKKMKDGKIREYMVFNELEMEVLSRYLSKYNITHKFYIQNKTINEIINMNKFRNNVKYYSNFFIRRRNEKIEYNKIKPETPLKIKIYKGFNDLSKHGVKQYTYGVYI